MNRYVAMFHTHLSAMRSQRALASLGVSARLAPVPRVLSASCGTCVRYEAAEPHLVAMDRDIERIAEEEDGGYKIVFFGK